MTWTTLPRSKLSSKIAAYQAGTGSPMLMLHGVGMHADYWSNLTPQLEKHFSLTVIDMPGHGESPLLAENTTLKDYTNVIANAVHGEQQTIVVGHSMGAMIALDLAVRYPELVAGVAVLNSVYRRADTAQRAIEMRAAELSAGRLKPGCLPDPEPTLERWFGKPVQADQVLAESCCRGWLNNANIHGYAHAYRVFANSDAPSDTDLQSIQCPVLVMTGSDEPNSTPEMSFDMSKQMSDSRCVIVEGARHMMSMTHSERIYDDLTNTFVDLQHQPINPILTKE